MSARRAFNTLTGFDVVRWKGMHTDVAALARSLAQYRVDCVIDVGANDGQFGRKVRSVYFRGDMVSFEPVGVAFRNLKRLSSKDTRWYVHKLALGAEPGYADINISEETQFSSFLSLSEFAKKNWASSKVTGTERVEITTLDALNASGLFKDYNSILLKVDTQGFDLQVLNGGRSILERVPLIYMEVSFRAVYEGSPSFQNTFDHLAALGYHPSAIYPVTRSKDLTVNEADVLFAKRS